MTFKYLIKGNRQWDSFLCGLAELIFGWQLGKQVSLWEPGFQVEAVYLFWTQKLSGSAVALHQQAPGHELGGFTCNPPFNVSSHSMQQILVLYCLSKNISIAVMAILTNSSLCSNTQRLNAYYAILKCYELHIGSLICYSVSLTLHTAISRGRMLDTNFAKDLKNTATVTAYQYKKA